MKFHLLKDENDEYSDDDDSVTVVNKEEHSSDDIASCSSKSMCIQRGDGVAEFE